MSRVCTICLYAILLPGEDRVVWSVYVYIGVGSMMVARSDRLGNLRASVRGTGSSQSPRSLFVDVSDYWFVYRAFASRAYIIYYN